MPGTYSLGNRFEAVRRPPLQLEHGPCLQQGRHLLNRLSIKLGWGRWRGCQANFHSAPSPMAYVANTISKPLGRRGWRETRKELMLRDLIRTNVIWSDSSMVRFGSLKQERKVKTVSLFLMKLNYSWNHSALIISSRCFFLLFPSSPSVLWCALCSVLVSGPPGVDGSRNKSKNTIAIHI